MKSLARAILDAQKIRGESFDHVAADKLQHSDRMIKDFKSCYTKSMQDAADEAAENEGFDTRGSFPIYLLCTYCGNAIQDWAKETLK